MATARGAKVGGVANATDAFNPTTQGGTPREDTLGETWPGADPSVGSGVAGVVSGYDTFKSHHDDSKMVTVLKLAHAVTLDVHPGTPGGALVLVGDVGVVVGAGLRGRVGDAACPVGSYVSIRFTGLDASKRNMRTYDVYDVDKPYLVRLHAAAAKPSTPPPVAKPVPPFPDFPEAMDGDDDLPF